MSTTTPLPPAIQPVAWFEYARKKPTLKRLVFDRTSRSQLRVAGWVSEPLVKESDATAARADLEAEVQRLREALGDIGQYTGEGPTSTPWRDIVKTCGEKARAVLKDTK